MGNVKGARSELDRLHDSQRANVEKTLRNREACEELWMAVIERAIADIEYLRMMQDRNDLNRYERETIDRILASPPSEFLDGPWFEHVCHQLGLDPERIRSRVRYQEVRARRWTRSA